MNGLLLAALATGLLMLRQYVFLVLAAAVMFVYVVWGDGRFENLVIDGWEALNQDILLPIPLYMLAGAIMAEGAIAGQLVRVMRALTGPIPGGLAVATCLSCGLFASVVGSSTVTLLAVGTVMYPALLAGGYSKSFSIGLICAGATLGIIIPPSIPLILYGVMTATSIADLFIAGIGPGLLLLGLFAVYSMVVNWRLRSGRWDLPELLAALRSGVWALLMPVLILGGIYSGLFTATESAAIAVVYAVVIELFVYRRLDLRVLLRVTTETTRLLGALFPVLMMALALNKFLTFEQVPGMMIEQLERVFDTPGSFILATNLLLLAIGSVMDIGSAILILAPILQPVAEAQGMHPVHFGIMMTVNLEIGYLTPPLGLNLIVAMTAFRENFWLICKAVLPFIGLMAVGLAVVALWPPLSLFLLG
ncbi:MAG: TRAP transporter large permease [Steroidobacteraceae bacterium]|nr:TRAP transporter large permease [Nevskiaceae bacterium]MCP5467113.1 TRAP transporter large permease [Nevskiaceae bacterium]